MPFLCRVELLDSSNLTAEIEKTANGRALLDHVFNVLNLRETEYFGLEFRDSKHKLRFLDGDKPMKKQLKDTRCTFQFVVKLYPASPSNIIEDITRSLVCLQVRRDLWSGRVPCGVDAGVLLGSLVVQAELGDYDPQEHQEGYLGAIEFVKNYNDRMLKRVSDLHPTHRGLTPAQADFKFLDRACRLEMYGVHFYPVTDPTHGMVRLAVSWAGLVVYDGHFPDHVRRLGLPWRQVSQLAFNNKKLKVYDIEEREFLFSCETRRDCKKLWKICAEHHTFFRRKESQKEKSPVLRGLGMPSRFRYSGRTQRQVMEDSLQNGHQTEFTRTPNRTSGHRLTQEPQPRTPRTSSSAANSRQSCGETVFTFLWCLGGTLL